MHQKKYTRKRKGGKAIGRGGFGCIFRPALKCASSRKSGKQSRKRVSKLGFKYNVEREMQQLSLVKKYLKKIPNYKKYFLLGDIDACRPAPLTKKDKIGYDKCLALEEYNITEQTVNDNLQQLMVINMPYGGVTLSHVIEESKLSFNVINNMLQNLLLSAIIPMNRLNVYHFDLKTVNILYKRSSFKIIDFGEIGIISKAEPIPPIGHRPIQFNIPFSNILFSDYMNFKINDYLNKTNESGPKLYKKLHQVIAKAYEEYKLLLGIGHDRIGGFLSHYILPGILELIGSTIEPEELLKQLIVDYCTRAVYSFIDFKAKKFDKVRYFNEVYSKNVDIYGWIMCYVDFILRWQSPTGNDIYNNSSNEIKFAIANIIQYFCFSDKYADRPISIDAVLEALNSVDSGR